MSNKFADDIFSLVVGGLIGYGSNSISIGIGSALIIFQLCRLERIFKEEFSKK